MKKLLDLRPCDSCHGHLKGGMFHLVRASLAFVKQDAVNQYMGMHQFFGRRMPAAIVENFAPEAADAVVTAGEQEPSLMVELVLCTDCYAEPVNLAVLAEARAHQLAEAEQDQEGES